ncbi:sigma-70 family RNA polymerase sigma factor [Chitinophagaceae bacterium LB-8]|uniref:Sigma-70 family RNA polymerase sigma factor n=1 Tax=Paraflavisolibacter caeni TaxID=2982496 RepID=A0A9X2XPR1_9BACT|nr:sigma-70 family RNA polymerase sigma factor [Paraflavisolibacter caeni]MCU7551968.1 sigma-70 family RNA polymerase sigma factor [Paraflavisolibacter caeni]
MPHPDQKYIDALVNNDFTLLEELYQKFSGKIKWMVLQNNGSSSDAADIFQEALMSIFHKAKTQNFTLSCPLDAFLYVVCKNKWLKELNKRKAGGVTNSDPEEYHIGENCFLLAEECQLKQERMELLHEKLSELGESCQQLLRLSWSGKSMDEVAQILKVTYGYARKKKSECMSKLMQLVKQSPKFDFLKW